MSCVILRPLLSIFMQCSLVIHALYSVDDSKVGPSTKSQASLVIQCVYTQRRVHVQAKGI